MQVNGELISSEVTHIWKGIKVKVFLSTLHKGKFGHQRTVTAEIMEGRHKGKWTTVNLDLAQPIVKKERKYV